MVVIAANRLNVMMTYFRKRGRSNGSLYGIMCAYCCNGLW